MTGQNYQGIEINEEALKDAMLEDGEYQMDEQYEEQQPENGSYLYDPIPEEVELGNGARVPTVAVVIIIYIVVAIISFVAGMLVTIALL